MVQTQTTCHDKQILCGSGILQQLMKQAAQLMLTNPRDAFTPGMVSY